MPRLTLIDGSSYLFRAFHALPPLTNAAGEPTGALYGVVNMLRATLADAPDYVAFVSDAPGPTFRDALYPAYKANRPPAPEDLHAQVQPMLAIVEALGLPVLCVPGVEADDVIGTLALAASGHGIDVTISTSDKDFAQLVGGHVVLANTMTGTRMDAQGVKEKFGVAPEQIVDYLTLVGDSVDNVPGVPKCGPKTAAKWLDAYGTLDELIAHVDEIGGKIGENLRAALPQLPLSRQLVTIKTDVALELGPTDLRLREPDTGALRELYARYEFRAALKELDAGPGETGAPSRSAAATGSETSSQAGTAGVSPPLMPSPEKRDTVDANYELVLTREQFDAWLDRLRSAELIAFDSETTSLDPMRAEIVGVSFAVKPGEACYIPLAHDYPGAPEQLDRDATLTALAPLLQDPERPKLGQHLKYDINVLSRHGITLRGMTHDSMLESYVLNPTAQRHDMDTLAKKYLGHDTIHYEDVAGKGARQIPFSQVDLDTACRYAAEDADITLRLHHVLWPQLQQEAGPASVYRDIEIPLVSVLARMEQRGILVDAADLKRQSSELGRRMLEVRQAAWQLAGHEFNLDSPKQLQAILFDQLGLPALVKTPKGQPSTNEEALEAIAGDHELPRLILDYRGYAKLRSTYTEKLAETINPDTGRVHTSYHQAVAATGRLSSSDPNLQNIPVRTPEGRRIRQAFIAPTGWRLLAADYSQIELRIMAHLSGDERLLAAFAAGADIHRATAAEVLGVEPENVTTEQRRAAKAVNFGLIYGMGAFGLARQLGISRGEAQDYIARYFARYPGVHEYMERTRVEARERGYVETLFGRRLYLDEIRSRNPARRAAAERAAINAPMQGSAADIIKRAMLDVDAWLSPRDDAHMLLQVHDELVFEVREDALAAIREGVAARMQGAAELAVPLVVDIGVGANWDEAH